MQVEAWLERAARTAPGRVAIETPTGVCDYAGLRTRARAGAAHLRGLGVEPGQRVAIDLAPGLDFAVALHSCLLAGAVAVPVDPRLAPAERTLIEASAPIVLGEPLPVRAATPEMPSAMHDLEATAVIIHTSGTTAAPRPVELTYGNLLWSALGSAVALGLDPGERWLCALPLSHVGGLSILLRSSIYATTAVVHERFETDRALDALMNREITLVSVVATTLARLLDAGLAAPPRLRCALTGGGPVGRPLVARAREASVPVSLTYGLTETSSQATTAPVAGLERDDSHTAGPPLFCTRVRIAADSEILVQGPTVARTAELVDGWLQTGDLGSLDEQGRLQVTGRKADTIVSGGENVAPAEVEAVLEGHPAVLEAAVFGRADPQWGEAVTALIVSRGEGTLEAEELRAHCAAALSPFKVPKAFLFQRDPLPRTRSGKLLRRELAP